MKMMWSLLETKMCIPNLPIIDKLRQPVSPMQCCVPLKMALIAASALFSNRVMSCDSLCHFMHPMETTLPKTFLKKITKISHSPKLCK